jgi:hypothetical protein
MESLNHYPLFILRSPHTIPPTHYNSSKSSKYPLGTSESPFYRQDSSKSESTSSRCRDKYRRKREERISNQLDAITITRAEADAFPRQLLCRKNHVMRTIDIWMSIASSMLQKERGRERAPRWLVPAVSQSATRLPGYHGSCVCR